MGFRVALNSTISIDGYPYIWNFGHSHGYNGLSPQTTTLTSGGIGVGSAPWQTQYPLVNGARNSFGYNINYSTAERFTYESVNFNFQDYADYLDTRQKGWYLYYDGSSSKYETQRSGSDRGGNISTETQFYFFSEYAGGGKTPMGVREMITLWDGKSLTDYDKIGWQGRRTDYGPAISLGSKWGYCLAAKSSTFAVGQPLHASIGNTPPNAFYDGRAYLYATDENDTFLGTLRNSTFDGTDIKGSVTSIVKNGTTTTVNLSSSTNMPSIGQFIHFNGITGVFPNLSGTDMQPGVFKVTGTPTSTSFTVTTTESQPSHTISTLPASSVIRILDSTNASGGSLLLGSSLDISDNGIIVSGAESSKYYSPNSGGAVLIYNRNLLNANSSIATSPQRVIGVPADSAYERFGASVSIIRANSFGSSQNKLYVGSPGYSSNTGIVNVYNLDSINELPIPVSGVPNEFTSQRIAQISASDYGYSGNASRFGEKIASGEGLVAISAPDYSEGGVRIGAVYLIRASDNSLVKILKPPASLRLTESITSIVGTGNTTVTINGPSTSTYAVGDLIEIDGAYGTEESKLNGRWAVTEVSGQFTQPPYFRIALNQNFNGTFTNGSASIGNVYIRRKFTNSIPNQFGNSISIASNRIVIGDPYSNLFGPSGGQFQFKGAIGAFFVYDLSGNLLHYDSLEYLFSGLLDDNGGAGSSVCVGNGKIFVGAPNHRASFTGTVLAQFGLVDFERSVRTGSMMIYSLDGIYLNSCHREYRQNFQETQDPWYGYDSDFPDNSNNYDVGLEYSGFGWASVFYNDTLYVSKLGTPFYENKASWPPDVVIYKNLTRTYTPFDAVQLQKGAV